MSLFTPHTGLSFFELMECCLDVEKVFLRCSVMERKGCTAVCLPPFESLAYHENDFRSDIPARREIIPTPTTGIRLSEADGKLLCHPGLLRLRLKLRIYVLPFLCLVYRDCCRGLLFRLVRSTTDSQGFIPSRGYERGAGTFIVHVQQRKS